MPPELGVQPGRVEPGHPLFPLVSRLVHDGVRNTRHHACQLAGLGLVVGLCQRCRGGADPRTQRDIQRCSCLLDPPAQGVLCGCQLDDEIETAKAVQPVHHLQLGQGDALEIARDGRSGRRTQETNGRSLARDKAQISIMRAIAILVPGSSQGQHVKHTLSCCRTRGQ